jgi:hypothetical protein
MTTLPVVISTDLLPKKEYKSLSEIAPELKHAYSCRQIFRTDTEARVSVLDDLHFPTKASKYWQAIREQMVMLEQLSLLSFDYRRNEVKIRRNKKIVETSKDEFEIEEAQINLDECMFRRMSMKSTASDRVREIHMWSAIKSELNDGSFDINDPNTHQLVSYTTQFALRAASVNPENLSEAELTNLQGQYQTALKHCDEKGILNEVVKGLPKELSSKLEQLIQIQHIRT